MRQKRRAGRTSLRPYAGRNLLPVLGLVADTENRIVFSPGRCAALARPIRSSRPLPPVDSSGSRIRFSDYQRDATCCRCGQDGAVFILLRISILYNYALDQNGLWCAGAVYSGLSDVIILFELIMVISHHFRSEKYLSGYV